MKILVANSIFSEVFEGVVNFGEVAKLLWKKPETVQVVNLKDCPLELVRRNALQNRLDADVFCRKLQLPASRRWKALCDGSTEMVIFCSWRKTEVSKVDPGLVMSAS